MVEHSRSGRGDQKKGPVIGLEMCVIIYVYCILHFREKHFLFLFVQNRICFHLSEVNGSGQKRTKMCFYLFLHLFVCLIMQPKN